MSIFSFFARMFFPIRCLRCGRFDTYLCRTCESFVFAPGASQHPHPSIHHLFWAGLYNNPFLQKLIHDGKYASVATSFEPACDILISLLPRAQFDLIIPIPLHPRRRRERGFNQAEIIANALSKAIHVPVAKNCLIRVRYTYPQVKLSYEQRQTNLTHAFRIQNIPPPSVRSILLVDDVWTTGATMHAAAQALSELGKYTLTAVVIAKD